MGSVAYVEEERNELVKDVHKLAHSGVHLMNMSYSGLQLINGAKSSFIVDVK